MSQATGFLLARNSGQAALITAVAVELVLVALLTLALEVARAAWDRAEVQSALLLASHAAVREIVMPVGPQGVRLDPAAAESAFTQVLALDLPAALARTVTARMAIVGAAEIDPHTGFVFHSQGVMASASFRDVILGASFAQTLYVDTEVHTGVDWTTSPGRLPLGLLASTPRTDRDLSGLGVRPGSRAHHHLPGMGRAGRLLLQSGPAPGDLHG